MINLSLNCSNFRYVGNLFVKLELKKTYNYILTLKTTQLQVNK